MPIRDAGDGGLLVNPPPLPIPRSDAGSVAGPAGTVIKGAGTTVSHTPVAVANTLGPGVKTVANRTGSADGQIGVLRQLWNSFVSALKELFKDETAQFYQPQQPIGYTVLPGPHPLPPGAMYHGATPTTIHTAPAGELQLPKVRGGAAPAAGPARSKSDWDAIAKELSSLNVDANTQSVKVKLTLYLKKQLEQNHSLNGNEIMLLQRLADSYIHAAAQINPPTPSSKGIMTIGQNLLKMAGLPANSMPQPALTSSLSGDANVRRHTTIMKDINLVINHAGSSTPPLTDNINIQLIRLIQTEVQKYAAKTPGSVINDDHLATLAVAVQNLLSQEDGKISEDLRNSLQAMQMHLLQDAHPMESVKSAEGAKQAPRTLAEWQTAVGTLTKDIKDTLGLKWIRAQALDKALKSCNSNDPSEVSAGKKALRSEIDRLRNDIRVHVHSELHPTPLPPNLMKNIMALEELLNQPIEI